MKRTSLFLQVIFLIFFISCPAKRNLYAPVLLEYKLIYPDEARRMGLEGKVTLGVLINESGRVEQVKIIKSSVSPVLDSAALKTAFFFIFSPAMHGDRPVKTWISLPVEFRFDEVKPDQWFLEVRDLQKAIEREYKEETVIELYKLYKKLIFSPRKSIDIKVNDFVKNAVLDTTAKLWDGYWKLYPATPILFFDIMYRYPNSYARFEAEEEFNEYFKEEAMIIHSSLSSVSADTLIMRLNKAVGRQD